MNQFEMLQVKIEDEVILTTYDVDAMERLFQNLAFAESEETIVIKRDRPFQIRLYTKNKKNKTRISVAVVLNRLGQAGWEPYAVDATERIHYFKRLKQAE